MNRFAATLVAVFAALAADGSSDVNLAFVHVSSDRVDVAIANKGRTPHTTRYDAQMDVVAGQRPVCRVSTNLVTPLDGGASVLAFRIRSQNTEKKAETYSIRLTLTSWDAPDRKKEDRAMSWRVPGPLDCLTLKPPQ